MKEIYKEATKRNIEILPFQKDRLDKTIKEYILPKFYVSKLKDEDFKKYLKALYNVRNENAGGYNGWTTAHKIFEELGFIKKERRSGHRVFVSYSFKN